MAYVHARNKSGQTESRIQAKPSSANEREGQDRHAIVTVMLAAEVEIVVADAGLVSASPADNYVSLFGDDCG